MSIFKLQQFSVQQSSSAMKVCSDSLIFGAMVPIAQGDTVLDIGAGTGLLSLMAKQLGASTVTAVELTTAAAQEAALNVNNSPWPDDIKVIEQDIIDYAAQHCTQHHNQRYDLIIANPPFFENHLKNKDQLRNTARHTDTLSFASLLTICANLVADNGRCYLLVPIHQIDNIVHLANSQQLQLIQQTTIIGFEHGAAKLAALTFIRMSEQVSELSSLDITIYHSPGQYTAQSSAYLAPFLLRFANQ